MRICILSDAYLPESTLIHSKMLHELAEELLKRDHEVVVFTPGLANQKRVINRGDIDGVDVWKFRCKPTRGVSHFKRAINETLLSWYAYRAIKQEKLNSNFDLVINYSPTIFFGPLVKWFRLHGAYVYLVLRDFFPQWAIDEGLIGTRSIIAKYFRFFEHLNYHNSNLIAVQSPANVAVFKQISKPKEYPLEVLYNWAAPLPKVNPNYGISFLQKLNLENKYIFFYGGNIGHAQDIPYILRLAEQFTEQSSAHFLILGQGDQFEAIQEQINEMSLSNVTLTASVNQEEYRSILTQVNIGVFTLASSHRAHNFPGKILGYLAAGLPILGAVNNGNDLIELVNESGSGKVSINGNFDQFFQDALTLYNSISERNEMSNAAHHLLKDLFSVQTAADKILSSYYSRGE